MCLLKTHWEQYEQLSKEVNLPMWESYCRDMCILFDNSLIFMDKPTLLTRYTLDNMDSAWNKLLEND